MVEHCTHNPGVIGSNPNITLTFLSQDEFHILCSTLVKYWSHNTGDMSSTPHINNYFFGFKQVFNIISIRQHILCSTLVKCCSHNPDDMSSTPHIANYFFGFTQVFNLIYQSKIYFEEKMNMQWIEPQNYFRSK